MDGGPVTKYTMQRFLTHDAIAAGLFDTGYTSGVSAYIAWAEELRNNPAVLKLLLERMESDYLQTRGKGRKAYTLGAACRFSCFWLQCDKNEDQLQRSCAGFSACLSQFQRRFPDSFVKEELPGLMKAFLGLCSSAWCGAPQVHVPPRGRRDGCLAF